MLIHHVKKLEKKYGPDWSKKLASCIDTTKPVGMWVTMIDGCDPDAPEKPDGPVIVTTVDLLNIQEKHGKPFADYLRGFAGFSDGPDIRLPISVESLHEAFVLFPPSTPAPEPEPEEKLRTFSLPRPKSIPKAQDGLPKKGGCGCSRKRPT